MLRIKLKGPNTDAVWVMEKHYGIGCDAANHLVLDDSSISPHHAKLITRDNKLYLKDNNSRAGSYVNNRRVTRKQVVPGDLIRLGEVEIEVLAPEEQPPAPAAASRVDQPTWTLVSDSSWLAGQSFRIVTSPVTIGRGSDCDITIPGTHLSRQHVEISSRGSRLHIRDLASANGTYINDNRIQEGVAGDGDRLRLDVYSFRIVGPDTDGAKTRVRTASGQPSRSSAMPKTPAAAKQWKTRSTSPGNRDEPPRRAGHQLLAWVSAGLVLLMIATLIFLFGMV
ncbi:FHA domain-containing protein [Exilibacterium tricleocarpae]|uniref:FHA domain-containing protein n=1 Tax=Exilibacterium tricleocarpae TaxID=2591008 RepID=A0A545STJ3_9GAMM|nr:FHA domain-containing protein [Exilibacterium tricleocarpae]TQV68271.1 FHA domain-containing protein [Exilibacterium tricleocarpae]